MALRDFINSFDKLIQPDKEVWQINAFYLGHLMRGSRINPDILFTATFYIRQWLINTTFKEPVENKLTDYLVERWMDVIENQRFNLLQPIIAVPDIKSAISDTSVGTVKLSKILLAAEIAVRHKLDANLRSNIKTHSLQKKLKE